MVGVVGFVFCVGDVVCVVGYCWFVVVGCEMSVFFEVIGILVSFDGFCVINNLFFVIVECELCVIIGLNGVGKIIFMDIVIGKICLNDG